MRALVCTLIVSGLLAACTSPHSDPSPGSATSPSPPSSTVTPLPTPPGSSNPEPSPAEQFTWPLTGQATERDVERPAVAVKIENSIDARPQYGLDSADVVWETVVEAGISRFIAIYHSNYPGEIGPVRSVRPVDIPIVAPLNGLLVYSGGQRGVLRIVHATPSIQSLTEDSGNAAMWRNASRRPPHNLNANVKSLAALAGSEHSDSPQQMFSFAQSAKDATAVEQGSPAKALSVTLSVIARPHWKWSAADGWLRYEGNTPAVTASGDHLSATNVVLIFAKKMDSGFTDTNGAAVPNYDLLGTGKAVIATGGKVLEGAWEKRSNTSHLTLNTADGGVVSLAPGNTWIELVPTQTGTYAVGADTPD